MIARDLQRARNTRITDGNEPGMPEIRNQRGNGTSQSPLRSALKGSAGPVRRDLSESFSRSQPNPHSEKLEQLQRQLMEAQTQNERLQHECNNMVDNYTRKIEAQEDTIRVLN